MSKDEDSKPSFFSNSNSTLPQSLPEDPVSRADIEHVKKYGYVVLENVFSREEAQEARQEMIRLSGDAPMKGRNAFEGLDTNRIYSLLNKTRVFDKFCIIPRVIALNDYFLDPGYMISAFHSIQINPQEDAQELHHDDGFCRVPRPRPPLGSAIITAFDDFTLENGPTNIVPGSHEWGSRKPKREEAIPMTCPAGSAVYFLATTWHSGGQNKTDQPRMSATVQYCQPYVRQIENQFLAVDPRRLEQIPKEIVKMMGYQTHYPFIGYADGMSPYKASKRMVNWLQKPMDPEPPAYAKNTSKL